MILLSGVVGSTAYGLAGPGSDVDRLGVFAAPTTDLFRLSPPAESRVTTDPDVTLHELAKWIRLSLSCNPTVTELVWLPSYEIVTDLGREMIALRSTLLSAARVRDAYLGYAAKQFHKLSLRPPSADMRQRTAKHARHLLRLCWQGYVLYTTGEVRVRLPDPETFLEFGERVADGDVEAARRALADYEAKFAAARTVLPDRPDRDGVENWLVDVRVRLLESARDGVA